MAEVIREWLRSGQFISIGGIHLLPLSVEEWPDTPLAIKSSRAEIYYLKDPNDQFWVIKKFFANGTADIYYRNSIKPLIPYRQGFESGYLRSTLNQSSIANFGAHTLPLSEWIENAILMPAVDGIRWATLVPVIAGGKQYLSQKQRMRIVFNLSEKIKWLESQDISHRNLSSTNVYVDMATTEVHLVDWDAIFHPTLPTPDKLTHVATGYIPPFVKVRGTSGVQNTWRVRADRFSLSLLNAEILGISTNSPLTEENVVWEQDEIYNRSGPCLLAIIAGLKAQFPKAADLLEQALEATGFDECPAPENWMAFLSNESAIKTMPIPVRERPAWVRLNKAGFTKLDKTVLTKLKRHIFVKPPRR